MLHVVQSSTMVKPTYMHVGTVGIEATTILRVLPKSPNTCDGDYCMMKAVCVGKYAESKHLAVQEPCIPGSIKCCAIVPMNGGPREVPSRLQHSVDRLYALLAEGFLSSGAPFVFPWGLQRSEEIQSRYGRNITWLSNEGSLSRKHTSSSWAHNACWSHQPLRPTSTATASFAGQLSVIREVVVESGCERNHPQ